MRFKTFLNETAISGRIVDGNDLDDDGTFTRLTRGMGNRLDSKSFTGQLTGDDPVSKLIQLIASKRHLKMSDPDLRTLIDPLAGKQRGQVAERLKQTHAALQKEFDQLVKFIDTAKGADGKPLFPAGASSKASAYLMNVGHDQTIDEIYTSWASFTTSQLVAKIKDLETSFADKVLALINGDKPVNKQRLTASAMHYLTELRKVTNDIIQELLKPPVPKPAQ
jgi:hypothetical protein